MIWVQITTEKVLEHMPTDVKARYDLWLDAHPEKEGRLATITANTIREFRDGIKSNPANIYHTDETYLPQSAVRHCENIIIYTLAMEMGLHMTTTGNSARTSADMFLRQLPFGRWNTTTEDAGAPSPRWIVPERSDIGKRALPALLAFFLLISTACASWIQPGREMFDWQILPTHTPQHYTNTTITLYGHLAGIDARFGSFQSQLSSVPIFHDIEEGVSLNFSFYPAGSTLGDRMWLSTSRQGLRVGWQDYDEGTSTPSYLLLDPEGNIPSARFSQHTNVWHYADGTATIHATVGVLPNRLRTAGAGVYNKHVGDYSIAFGYNSQATSSYSTVSGGWNNFARGAHSSVGGGYGNTASGNSSAIPGGFDNTASGSYSFSAGRRARATNDGAFVWSDSRYGLVYDTGENTFNVYAQGGSYFETPTFEVTGANIATVFKFPLGDYLSADGTNLFYTTSDGAITTQITSH